MRHSLAALSAGLVALACSPAAMAATHHRHPGHHGRRHHARIHHIRIRRFGEVNGGTSAASGSGSSAAVGTVQAYTNGVLTILLADNSTVQGTVTADTEFECVSASGSSSGEDQGSEDAQGEDSGTQGEDSGTQGSGGQEDQTSQTSADSGDTAEQSQTQPGQDADEDSGQSDEDGGQSSCSSADLTPGTVVQAAELRLTSNGAEWEKLVLEL